MEDTVILFCKYCNEPEDKQNKAGLICDSCYNFVHLICLRNCGTPGDFPCDVFFRFVCEDCSMEKREVFVRYKFPWVNVIYLAMYHLSTHSYGISRRGYFHFKTHVCSFIDRHWQTLFGSSNKQKKNWVGTIAGVLSVYNKILFKSGSVALGEAGWWKLLHNFSPAVAAHSVQEMAKDKPRNRQRNQPTLDKNHFLAKIAEMGYKDYLNNEADERSQYSEQIPQKKRRMNSGDSGGSSFYAIDENSKSEYVLGGTYEDSLQLQYGAASELPYGELAQIEEQNVYDTVAKLPGHLQNDTTSSYQHYYYDSDSRSSDQTDKKTDVKTKRQEDKPYVRKQSLFSTELNSETLPWEGEGEGVGGSEREGEVNTKGKVEELTQYQEIQLLKQVETLISKVKDPSKKAFLCRFKAKLALRRLKRHKHLPIFDLDKTVKLLGGYVTEDPRVVTNAERVLDRFQRSYLMENLCGTISTPSSGTVLLSAAAPTPFRSAYSGTTLKPYIRRDAASAPLWLRLTDELLRRTNRHIKDYTPPPRATIDYSYIRPQHIAAVNQLVQQFFWPGIDLTEALQYPEFSCVVHYKRVVVGCAFLVPDAGRHEAYISFVFTRPEWRRAGVATFMLYHLLQTCTGKDVTLHVSPTNPSVFLYQKFGFKVEELVQDFYEKYYDIDYKGCRHALFLRLVR